MPFRLRNHDVHRATLKLVDANDVWPNVQAFGPRLAP
ncbi:MAG: hypothetical protein ABI128_11745 [Rhodanobacter sp.]